MKCFEYGPRPLKCLSLNCILSIIYFKGLETKALLLSENPYRGERLSTVDLLVLTSSYLLVGLNCKHCLLINLSLPLLVFLGFIFVTEAKVGLLIVPFAVEKMSQPPKWLGTKWKCLFRSLECRLLGWRRQWRRVRARDWQFVRRPGHLQRSRYQGVFEESDKAQSRIKIGNNFS